MRFKEDFLERIDAYASQMNISRTAAITVIVNNHLQGLEVMKTMQDMKEIYDNERKEKVV